MNEAYFLDSKHFFKFRDFFAALEKKGSLSIGDNEIWLSLFPSGYG